MATILVVDDEPDIRQLVQLNLELDGHRVITAANGKEALEVLDTELPDVMLLDLNMPEVDGWAVLQAIKDAGDVDVNRIPVLMLTAYDSADSRLRGGIEGAIRYITKPFSPDALRDEIRDALEGDPEPVKRRKVQQAALEQLARIEKGSDPMVRSPFTRPHITRLEHRPTPTPEPKALLDARDRLSELTDKQRGLLERLASAASVSDAATDLGVSRSNVYASLRRISRKLGIASVPDLLVLVRDGTLLGEG
jgi:DNA-binding response OmpR family regulator/DNA-binding CsgD family transcriptional regulator